MERVLKTPLGVECPLFPQDVMTITQGINGSYSHKGTMFIDIAGKDGGIDPLFAPSKLQIKSIGGQANIVVAWSVEPVQWADGTVGHYTIRLSHDNYVGDLKVGQIIPQGMKFYDEGTKGLATGNHVHMGVARGHTQSGVTNAYGKWELVGEVEPFKLFFVNGITMRNGGGYTWKTYSAPKYATMKDVQNLEFKSGANKIRIRQLPSINYPQVGLVPPESIIPITQTSVEPCDGYDWVKLTYDGVEGYCAVVAGSEVIIVLTPTQILEKALREANEKIAKQNEIIKTQTEQITKLEGEVKSFVPVDTTVYKKQ